MEAIKPANEMSEPELVHFLETNNLDYRNGNESVPDTIYDSYRSELRSRNPEHPLLHQVEEEPDFGLGTIRHKRPMLSTDKAYTVAEMEKFIQRCEKAANELGMDATTIQYRLTPKLDGWSGNDEDGHLATRGDHLVGNDVTHIFDRGVVPVGGRNLGVGEIVILQSYWENFLDGAFQSPRNALQGVIKAEEPNVHITAALKAGAIRFVPYTTLPEKRCQGPALLENLEPWCTEIEQTCEYPTDGVIIELIDAELKNHLGSASDHHRWMVAKKTVGETAVAEVLSVTGQCGRTGIITPVINVETTFLSGCNISNITAHHFGLVKAMNIGTGAKIKIVRAGEVIPKFLSVEESGQPAELPTNCPSCSYPLEWVKSEDGESKFLKCHGSQCQAQTENRLLYFFHILGNINEFGPATIKRLVESGYRDLTAIYQLTEQDFTGMEFGPKQSQNLASELRRSTTQEVDDWRFLAAFGLRHLGRGSSRKLLAVHPIKTLGELTAKEIEAISGFGKITAPVIAAELASSWPLIERMLALGFNLRITRQVTAGNTPIKNKNIVFTGKMSSSRDDMQEMARQLGANVQSSVNKKTDLLIIGEKVGQKKIDAAKKNNTQVLSEAEYYRLLQEY